MSLRFGRLAQLGEHLPYKQRVIGSSPIATTIFCGLVVQLVRMPACHAGGHEFEPHSGRQFFNLNNLHMRKWLSGRASPCQGEGREFKSRLPLHFMLWCYSQVVRQRSATPLSPVQIWVAPPFFFFAQIAQSVEQRTENPRVGGSIPPLGTT